MNEVIENSLFKKNPIRFQELRKYVKEFNASYNGSNIIQDDIFSVARNYVAKNDKHLELLRLPIKDDDFCAFTCVRNGELFTVLNSALPLCKQNFAAGHELYHIWRYISDQDDSLPHSGSLLTAEDMDETTATQEDMEANAFSALLLVPVAALNEQIDVYGLDRKNLGLDAVVRLMDIFAVPFKAMVLRLFEEGILDKHATIMLLQQGTSENLSRSMQHQNIALRWQKRTTDIIDMGFLPVLLQQNQEANLLPERRITEDEQSLEEMNAWLSRK
ncbi:MAG: ImmA/IrrE family metallo-endopeptidase [Firmicutes bacterium]|nr:ImmA/IrrE family metallo-endopeptidase [Bacillota bacterium]